MENIISKKLLSEVLGYKNIFGEVKIKDNNLIFRYRYGKDLTNATEIINIYELAHKCKEDAVKKGYKLIINIDHVIIFRNNSPIKAFSDDGIYSIDLIFKAYDWILNNKASK